MRHFLRLGLIPVLVAMLLVGCGKKEDSAQAEITKQTPAATVIGLSGTAQVAREDARLPLAVGDLIFEADTVHVSQTGHIRVQFSDDAIVAIGRGGEFSVREYLFDGQTGKSDVYFARGTFEAITGTIGRVAPNQVTLQARTATMGIRGTHIIGEIIDDERITIAVVSGRIEVRETRSRVLPQPTDLPTGRIILLEPEPELPIVAREFEYDQVVPILLSTGNEIEAVDEVVKELLQVLSTAPQVRRSGDRFIVQIGINTNQIGGISYRLISADQGLGRTQINRNSGIVSIVPSDVILGDFSFVAEATAAGAQPERKRYGVRLERNREWAQIDEGDGFVIGLKTDGTLHGWGNNRYGQLADGSLVDRQRPVEIGIGTQWAQISAGADHVLALDTEGTLYSWGRNQQGQLGEGTLESRTQPTQIGTKGYWRAISAGSSHSLAISQEGKLYGWGQNTAGKLGDGTAFGRLQPRAINQSTDWHRVAAGDHHNLALKSDGSLWAWGRNDYGQLGDPNRLIAPEPIRITQAANWKEISAGEGVSFAIDEKGVLYGWGRNFSGQIGDGSDSDRLEPVRIGGDRRFARIFAGSDHTLALDTQGRLYGWGSNDHKQLGDGGDRQLTPIALGEEKGWLDVLSGRGYTLAIKPDRTFKGWGPVNPHVVETTVVSVFALKE